mgnify:CR=1 FL=1
MACPLVSSELLNYRTPVLLRIMEVIKGRLHELINANFHKNRFAESAQSAGDNGGGNGQIKDIEKIR